MAKVLRDRAMTRLAVRYPGYGWETNVGYGTLDHRARCCGSAPPGTIAPTFGAVRQLVLDFSDPEPVEHSDGGLTR